MPPASWLLADGGLLSDTEDWLPLHRGYWLMVGCTPHRGRNAPSRAVGGDWIVQNAYTPLLSFCKGARKRVTIQKVFFEIEVKHQFRLRNL